MEELVEHVYKRVKGTLIQTFFLYKFKGAITTDTLDITELVVKNTQLLWPNG